MVKCLRSITALMLGLLVNTAALAQGSYYPDLPNPGSYDAGSGSYGTSDWSLGFRTQNESATRDWAFGQTNTGVYGQWDQGQWDQHQTPDWWSPVGEAEGRSATQQWSGWQPSAERLPAMGFRPDTALMPRSSFRPETGVSTSPPMGFRFRGDPQLGEAAGPGGFHFRPLSEGDKLRQSHHNLQGFRPLNPPNTRPNYGPAPTGDDWLN